MCLAFYSLPTEAERVEQQLIEVFFHLYIRIFRTIWKNTVERAIKYLNESTNPETVSPRCGS